MASRAALSSINSAFLRISLVSCPRSSFNNFSDSGLFVLGGAKDLYVPNYQTVGAIFARWLSIKMTATATFLETFFCKELLGHDTRAIVPTN